VPESCVGRTDARLLGANGAHSTGVPLLRLPGTPGCRYSGLRVERSGWQERRLRLILTERPGFGASSRLPGRGFIEPADDLISILDHLGLEKVHALGGSGGAPHVLALAARHPDRVRAATVVVGAAPLAEEETATLIGANAESHRLIHSGDFEGFRRHLEQLAAALEDPIPGMLHLMREAPEADRVVMRDPDWQAAFAMAMRESLRPSVEGWFDEGIALETRGDEINLDEIVTSLTWRHAPGDANAPLSAVQRLLKRVPHARLALFRAHEGHLEPCAA